MSLGASATRATDVEDARTYCIVVTSRNDPKLHRCIESMLRLRHIERAEVSVVLDDSDSEYVARTRALLSSWPSGGRLIWQGPGGTISHARNRGARASRSPWVVFVDSDCVLQENYLERLAAAPPPNGVGTGCVIFVPTRFTFSRLNCQLRQIGYDEVYAHYAYMPNLVVARRLFEDVGGFEPGLGYGEDFEFSDRIRRAGHVVTHDADLTVLHLDDERWTKTVKNWFRNGVGGAFRYYRVRKEVPGTRLRDFAYSARCPTGTSLGMRAFTALAALVLNSGLAFGLLAWRRDLEALRTRPPRRTEPAAIEAWTLGGEIRTERAG